jgi:hypothetical protein
MASREALLASVGVDLKTYHDAELGLPADEMQKLTCPISHLLSQ